MQYPVHVQRWWRSEVEKARAASRMLRSRDAMSDEAQSLPATAQGSSPPQNHSSNAEQKSSPPHNTPSNTELPPLCEHVLQLFDEERFAQWDQSVSATPPPYSCRAATFQLLPGIHVGDPLLDDLPSGTLFDLSHGNGDLHMHFDIPARPPWADKALVERGQRVFLKHYAFFFSSLTAMLLQGYVIRRFSELLVCSAYAASPRHTYARYKATARFICSWMEDDVWMAQQDTYSGRSDAASSITGGHTHLANAPPSSSPSLVLQNARDSSSHGHDGVCLPRGLEAILRVRCLHAFARKRLGGTWARFLASQKPYMGAGQSSSGSQASSSTLDDETLSGSRDVHAQSQAASCPVSVQASGRSGNSRAQIESVSGEPRPAGNPDGQEGRDAGVLLSQFDMAQVLLGFSTVCLEAITTEFNIRLSREDRDALIHLWRYIGYYLGIHDRYNPCRSVTWATRCQLEFLAAVHKYCSFPHPSTLRLVDSTVRGFGSYLGLGPRYFSAFLHYQSPTFRPFLHVNYLNAYMRRSFKTPRRNVQICADSKELEERYPNLWYPLPALFFQRRLTKLFTLDSILSGYPAQFRPSGWVLSVMRFLCGGLRTVACRFMHTVIRSGPLPLANTSAASACPVSSRAGTTGGGWLQWVLRTSESVMPRVADVVDALWGGLGWCHRTLHTTTPYPSVLADTHATDAKQRARHIRARRLVIAMLGSWVSAEVLAPMWVSAAKRTVPSVLWKVARGARRMVYVYLAVVYAFVCVTEVYLPALDD